ncbi:MAG: D-glycerate dehydrogenase [Actinomycetota bacterium]|nr:D-glycerate dehydrogenase [Actinomycetota bacterium]
MSHGGEQREPARILVTRPLPGGLEVLSGHDVVVREDGPIDHSQLLAAVGDCDALICLLYDHIDADLLAAAPRLKAVATVAVGYDNIDVDAATEAGVLVCHTPGVLDDTVADLAVALMIGAGRRLGEAERDLRAGRWQGWDIDQYLGQDLWGATLGIVGYGRTGRTVSHRVTGFDMTVLHHCRTPTREEGYVDELGELLTRSDFVSLHVPLTDSTHHLISTQELEGMKPTAVLVNTSRGPVVDEEALVAALERGRIFAAGLDVFEDEPEVHPGLLSSPRALLVPHIASASWATRTRMARLAASGIAAALAGHVPDNAVNPEAWRNSRPT